MKSEKFRMTQVALAFLVLIGFTQFAMYLLGIANRPQTGIVGAYFLLLGIFLLQQRQVARRIDKLEKQVEELRAASRA